MSDLSATFIPTARDALIVVSYSGLGGRGLDYAFLIHPLRPESGFLVDNRGNVAGVPEDEWLDLQKLVADAKEVVVQGGGGSWSSPGEMSCPTDEFFQLGPGGGPESDALPCMFKLTGHMIRSGEPVNILHYHGEETEIVTEIPSALEQLARTCGIMKQKLLPYSPSARNCNSRKREQRCSRRYAICRLSSAGRRRSGRPIFCRMKIYDYQIHSPSDMKPGS
ncbi:hypothetical protein C8R43DRAFT_622366 [Mycena crocata]|nr:hypothetical protein C8R43DRAFT_622366 [Mycena crocata]